MIIWPANYVPASRLSSKQFILTVIFCLELYDIIASLKIIVRRRDDMDCWVQGALFNCSCTSPQIIPPYNVEGKAVKYAAHKPVKCTSVADDPRDSVSVICMSLL